MRTPALTMAVLSLGLLPLASRAQQMGQMGGMGGMDSGQQQRSRGGNEDILPDVDEEIAGDAQKVFDRAEKAYADEDWLDAIAHYQHLRTKFPYNVALVARAELRLGDVAFARERFGEARGHYRSFLRFHPKHEQADYAAFRIGLCAYRDIPGDSWFTPPSVEKDQSDVRDALKQMRDFVRNWPRSQYVKEASEVAVKCEDRLASHELYVAKFYAKRQKWKGTLLRTEGLVKRYPESRLAPEALVLAVEAHAALGEGEKARAAFERLAAHKPSEELLERGRSAVERLP